MDVLLAAALGYLLGSIPFGYLLTRAAGLGDVRAQGSGNIGATNVLRTGSKKLAAATLLLDLAKGGSPLADRIITTSPDVTVSTNLGAWVNQRGLFRRQQMEDVFRKARIPSAQKWEGDTAGQHLELGEVQALVGRLRQYLAMIGGNAGMTRGGQTLPAIVRDRHRHLQLPQLRRQLQAERCCADDQQAALGRARHF